MSDKRKHNVDATWAGSVCEEVTMRFLAWGRDRDLFVRPILMMSPDLEATLLAYKLTLVAAHLHAAERIEAVRRELRGMVHSATQRWSEQMMAQIGAVAEEMSGKKLSDVRPDAKQVQLAAQLAESRLSEADGEIGNVVAALKRGDAAPFTPVYKNLRGVSGGKSPEHEEHSLFGSIVQELYDVASHAVRLHANAPIPQQRGERPGGARVVALFLAILAIAGVAGGFVGGELSGQNFSATGAAIGFFGLAITLLALGALFDAQERKRSELTSEMRGVFDRMVTGKANPTSEEVEAAKRRLRR